MKSFQSVIIAALAVSAAAINEPVASPTAAVERELKEYERQLGTDVTGTPTEFPPRPTGGVSFNFVCRVFIDSMRGAMWQRGTMTIR